ncbi:MULTISPECIES: hypothetical protein [unclassified Caballeronia]|uniref:hypothetical protein n=1 Tax=unclassified Caballeronia TaxID=2646786 RepID=UPI00286686BF|nr:MULTISPECIES: hypothetical protein [unclassified Caballeronia]MDR5752604.1 hypothetical protein [Caballeronia sp. LZ024]MDR5841638.1 hypothetical protein [Caballeronia sp. LZ031]
MKASWQVHVANGDKFSFISKWRSSTIGHLQPFMVAGMRHSDRCYGLDSGHSPFDQTAFLATKAGRRSTQVRFSKKTGSGEPAESSGDPRAVPELRERPTTGTLPL